MSFGMFAGVFAVSMGLMYVGNLIGQILMLIVGLVTGKPVINGIEEVILAMEPWSVMLVAVIIGPIVEEVIFRKFLLDRIAGYGQLTAMFVSGLIFALAHGNFYQFFYAFAIGMVFAWVYLRTGRLRDTILLHMLINFCGSLVPMGIMSLMEKSMFLSVLLLLGELAVMFSMVILAVVLLICYRKEILVKTDRSQVSGMRWVRSVFLNPGMCLYYLAAGVMFFFS